MVDNNTCEESSNDSVYIDELLPLGDVSFSFKKKGRVCGACQGCTRSNCTKCLYCLDMPRYGGKGKKKQRCALKICSQFRSAPGIVNAIHTPSRAAAIAVSKGMYTNASCEPLQCDAYTSQTHTQPSQTHTQPSQTHTQPSQTHTQTSSPFLQPVINTSSQQQQVTSYTNTCTTSTVTCTGNPSLTFGNSPLKGKEDDIKKCTYCQLQFNKGSFYYHDNCLCTLQYSKMPRDGYSRTEPNLTLPDDTTVFPVSSTPNTPSNISGTTLNDDDDLSAGSKHSSVASSPLPSPKKVKILSGYSFPAGNISQWSVQNVKDFFDMIPECSDMSPLVDQYKISGITLLLLTYKSLVGCLGMKLGPALKVMSHIENLKEQQIKYISKLLEQDI